MQKRKEKLKGFNLRDMDASVRPQDDFYHYANGGWLAKNIIPENESWWGSFIILRHESEKSLKKIVDGLLARNPPKKGSPEQLVGDFYRSGMDRKRRNALGATPLLPLRRRIQKVSSTQELLSLLAYMQRIGVNVPWGAGADQDAKHSARYALHLYQTGLSLPDRDYYLKSEPEFVRVREAYKKHLVKMFGLLGYASGEAQKKMRVVLKIETLLAKVSMDKVDARDADKTYHKKSLAELTRLAPHVAWQTFFKEAGIGRIPYVIVMQPTYLAATAKMLKTVPIEEWKVYMEWQVLDDASSLLSDAFVKANFAFAQVLTGSKKMKPLWRRTLGVVNGALGEPLGKIYVKKFFDEKKKRKMDELVSDLFAVYEERIKKLDWMSPATKRKAVAKLRHMVRKIGYPKKWKSYAGLRIRPDDYFGNALRVVQFKHAREMKKLTRKSIDRDEWFMYPHTVNAYFHPTMNEIVFPAAILQPPFFNFDADDAFNYGGIGAVIGHEITHGFDDQGAKFDARGNLKNWWTPADKKQFEQKGRTLATQYNAFKVADGVRVNGRLTLGENIADLGGLVIGYEAYQRHLAHRGTAKIIAGLTPQQRFFLGFAQVERELRRPEFEKTSTLTDPHSPAQFRINGPLAHFEPFYKAYGVKKGDKLYRAPKDRAKIW